MDLALINGMGVCPPFGGAGAFDEEYLWWNDSNALASFWDGLQNGYFMGSQQQRQYMMQMLAMGMFGMGGQRRGGRRFGRRRNNQIERIWIQQAMGGLGGMVGLGMGGFGMGVDYVLYLPIEFTDRQTAEMKMWGEEGGRLRGESCRCCFWLLECGGVVLVCYDFIQHL